MRTADKRWLGVEVRCLEHRPRYIRPTALYLKGWLALLGDMIISRHEEHARGDTILATGKMHEPYDIAKRRNLH